MPLLFYHPQIKQRSSELRKNMTVAERFLWSRLRRKQIKGTQWYRQRLIGKFIVDFYCPTNELIIEIDGSQHFEDKGAKSDRERDEKLFHRGFRVLRFTNREVLDNIDGVLRKIIEEIDKSSPTLLFKRREKYN